MEIVIIPSFKTESVLACIKGIIEDKINNTLSNVKVDKISIIDSSFIEISIDNPLDLSPLLSNIFGICKFAICKKIMTNFDSLLTEISSIGLLVIKPHDKFFVDIEYLNSMKSISFSSKDLEFSAMGHLIQELSKKNNPAKPAKGVFDATKIINVLVSNNYSYICYEYNNGLGGLPYGFQKEIIHCYIHNIVSLLSAIEVIQNGFIPEIYLVYSKYEDLLYLSKLFEKLLNKIQTQKFEINLIKIDLSKFRNKKIQFALKELVFLGLIYSTNSRFLNLPVIASYHPISIILHIYQEQTKRSKDSIFFTPFIFNSNEDLIKISRKYLLDEKGLLSVLRQYEIFQLDESDISKSQNEIFTIISKSFDNIKKISIDVGPNYIHDILNSV